MIIKGVVWEDLINYKTPSMYISTARCSFKCDKECGMSCCQNSSLAQSPDIDINIKTLIDRYMNNPITHAIVFAGLEPMDQFNELWQFIHVLREEYNCQDDVVIYTGYNKHEIIPLIQYLKQYNNIVVKYGRFIPNSQGVFDPVLGVTLASNNQFAERIS